MFEKAQPEWPSTISISSASSSRNLPVLSPGSVMDYTNEKQIIRGQKLNYELPFHEPGALMSANESKGDRTGR